MSLGNLCLITVTFAAFATAEYSSSGHTHGVLGTGAHSAGFLGLHAGHLTGGKAVSELHIQPPSNDEVETHDFSESAAKNNPSLYESLGSYGDHLSEQHFPTDYQNQQQFEGGAENAAHEYAEAESAATTDHHALLESHQHEGGELEKHSFGELENHNFGELEKHNFGELEKHNFGEFHHALDFHEKPVPGIDHGKGAYSYSTTYEFKEPQKR